MEPVYSVPVFPVSSAKTKKDFASVPRPRCDTPGLLVVPPPNHQRTLPPLRQMPPVELQHPLPHVLLRRRPVARAVVREENRACYSRIFLRRCPL